MKHGREIMNQDIIIDAKSRHLGELTDIGDNTIAVLFPKRRLTDYNAIGAISGQWVAYHDRTITTYQQPRLQYKAST